MKKVLLAFAFLSCAAAVYADPGDVTTINTISPQNYPNAFLFIVRSTNVFVSTAAFSKNLGSADINLQHAMNTLDQLSTSGGGGGGTPGGSDTDVQFNQGGAFAGSSQLTYNTTSNILTVGATTQFSSVSTTTWTNVSSVIFGTGTFVNFKAGMQTSTIQVTSLSVGQVQSDANGNLFVGLVGLSSQTIGAFISSVNVNASLTVTSNGVNNSVITLAANPSSATLQGTFYAGSGIFFTGSGSSTTINASGSGGGGTPGGTNTELQYRSGASSFGAVPGSTVATSGNIVSMQTLNTGDTLFLLQGKSGQTAQMFHIQPFNGVGDWFTVWPGSVSMSNPLMVNNNIHANGANGVYFGPNPSTFEALMQYAGTTPSVNFTTHTSVSGVLRVGSSDVGPMLTTPRQFESVPSSANVIGEYIKALPAQSAPLSAWVSSAGVITSSVDFNGYFSASTSAFYSTMYDGNHNPGLLGQCWESQGVGLPPLWTTLSASGGGIVSPGTFTWTNNFGISASTGVFSSTVSATALTISTSPSNNAVADQGTLSYSFGVSLSTTLSATGNFLAGNGGTTGASFGFVSDPKMGFYRGAAGSLNINMEGVNLAHFDSTGLTMSGNLNASGGFLLTGTNGSSGSPDIAFPGGSVGWYYDSTNLTGEFTIGSMGFETHNAANPHRGMLMFGGSGAQDFSMAYNTDAGEWAMNVAASSPIIVNRTTPVVSIMASTSTVPPLLGYYGDNTSSVTLTSVNFPATGVYGDPLSLSLSSGAWLVTFTGCEQSNSATLTGGGVISISTSSGNNSTLLNEGQNLIILPLATATTDGCNSIPNYLMTFNVATKIYGKIEDMYSVGQPLFLGRLFAIRPY